MRRRVAYPSIALAALLMTACTGPSSTDTAFDSWFDQMQTVLRDENGVGGGGGASPGSVQLSSMRTGNWVVYAVCNDTDVVHLRIRGGSTTLAETDVPCGATVAMPITVSAAAARLFEIQTSLPEGITGTGWWSVQVNSTAWKQSRAFSFH